MYCDIPLFTRCCMCLPLRRGILTFGYISLTFDIYFLVKKSLEIHRYNRTQQVFQNIEVPDELTITLYCVDIIFDVLLIAGAHLKRLAIIKAYYYYSVAMFLVSIVLWIVDISLEGSGFQPFQILILFCSKSIQIYLLFIIRSLVMKLTVSQDHKYENPLEQIVYGEGKVEENGVCSNTTLEDNVKSEIN